MNGQKIYVKNREEIFVFPKFVYCSTIYKMWRFGASLLNEQYYTCDRPLDLNKITSKIKKKDYVIQKFIKLEGAPENYLINNGYRLKNE